MLVSRPPFLEEAGNRWTIETLVVSSRKGGLVLPFKRKGGLLGVKLGRDNLLTRILLHQ